MKRKLAFIFLAFVIGFVTFIRAEFPIILKANDEKKDWLITMSLKKFEEIAIHKKAYWWGVETSKPITIVNECTIQRKSILIEVPLSVYADLSNLESILVLGTDQACEIFLRGGQSAAAYEVCIVIKDKAVVERRVYNRNFPNILLEKTLYFSNNENR